MSLTELWTKLEESRRPFLDRARDCSAVTVPYIIPPEGFYEGGDLPDQYQNLGSRGVNNLASKLMLSLFPPDAPYFQLEPDPEAWAGVSQDDRILIESQLRAAEQLIQGSIESLPARPALYEALRHLLISGNCVLYIPDEGVPQVFGLDRFVVERDAQDRVKTLLLTSKVPAESVPKTAETLAVSSFLSASDSDYVDLITAVQMTPDGDYKISQEIGDKKLKAKRTVSAARCPYKVIRLNKLSGEPYGRGFVEDHLGDLQSLEGFSQAVAEGVAISVETKWLVDPGGRTYVQDLDNSSNGDYIPGRGEDVEVLQANKAMDLRVGQEMIAQLKMELKQDFLLLSGVQRQAERVTATEIQGLARELESALGGVYSTLTIELQLPLIDYQVAKLTEEEILPELESGTLEPRVVTGVEALGRSQELGRIQMASQMLQGLFGPQAIASMLDLTATATKIFNAAGLDSAGLVKSQEVMQEEQRAAQAQALMERAAPNIAGAIGQAATE